MGLDTASMPIRSRAHAASSFESSPPTQAPLRSMPAVQTDIFVTELLTDIFGDADTFERPVTQVCPPHLLKAHRKEHHSAAEATEIDEVVEEVMTAHAGGQVGRKAQIHCSSASNYGHRCRRYCLMSSSGCCEQCELSRVGIERPSDVRSFAAFAQVRQSSQRDLPTVKAYKLNRPFVYSPCCLPLACSVHGYPLTRSLAHSFGGKTSRISRTRAIRPAAGTIAERY